MAMSNAAELLDEYLIQTPYDPDRSPDLSKWKRLKKRQIVDLILETLGRYTWLREHDHELPDAHMARLNLRRLLLGLHTVKKLPCTEADLRTMLDLTVPLLGAISAEGPLDHVMEYIKTNDLTPELCHSLHEFQTHLTPQCSVGTDQAVRQRLYTLLWMDEWDELQPSKCWSESIRRDFRAMEGERKANWRRLLKHIRGNAPQNMPASWAREAAERLEAVGIDDFNRQLSHWFAPFRSGEPLPLTVRGSHILKGLIWYAAVSGDEHAKGVSLWLLDVKWKQKRNTEKVMTALCAFGVDNEELFERDLLKRPSSANLRQMMEKAFTGMLNSLRMFSNPGMEMDFDENMMVVQGQLHFYRLYRGTGRIERATDNAELELNWEAIPDQMRLGLNRESVSDNQLMTCASMLRSDSHFGHYFRVKAK